MLPSRPRVFVRPGPAVFFGFLILLLSPQAFGSQPVTVRIIAGPVCVEGEPRTDLASTFSQGVSFSARPLTVQEWEGRIE